MRVVLTHYSRGDMILEFEANRHRPARVCFPHFSAAATDINLPCAFHTTTRADGFHI